MSDDHLHGSHVRRIGRVMCVFGNFFSCSSCIGNRGGGGGWGRVHDTVQGENHHASCSPHEVIRATGNGHAPRE